MEGVAVETVEILAKTQFGIFVLGLVITVVSILWALTTFGIVKPKNGNSVHSVTEELRDMNALLSRMEESIGPKVESVQRDIAVLLDRSGRDR